MPPKKWIAATGAFLFFVILLLYLSTNYLDLFSPAPSFKKT